MIIAGHSINISFKKKNEKEIGLKLDESVANILYSGIAKI